MIRKTVLVFFTAAILLLAGYFVFRNTVLHLVISKLQDKIKTKYEADLLLSDAYFSGFSSVNIDSILLVPHGSDTLLKANHIEADISFLKLVTGKLPYKNL